MAINRELSQFGRLVQIIDNVSIGIGTTSNVSIGFGTISATTFSGSNILVGTATSTGTASQRLQVSGGAYVSDSVGIGTTNPTSKLHVLGNTLVSGVSTLGITTFTGPVSFGTSAFFGDNDSLNFGNNNDLQIVHDGSNSWITDTGTGYLGLVSNGTGVMLQKQGGEFMGRFLTDGSAELYYDNNKKFETLGTGVTITGTTFTNDLSVSGISTLGITSATNLTAQQLNVSGVSTLGNVSIGAGNTTLIVTGTARVSGAATFGNGITISSGNLNVPSGTASIAQGMSVGTSNGAFTYFGTSSNFTVASQTTGTLNLGGPNQTATQTFGQSASTHTANYASGASGVGTTKTINFGTGGASGSFTQINVGPTAGVGTVLVNTGTRLGIGSATPTSALTVVGDGKFSGVVTATSFSGDGSSLTNVGSASTIWRATSSGIHTLSSVGVGTQARSAHALTVLGTGSTALFVDGNARITGILSIGTGTVTIDGDTSTIVATNFIGELTSIFPSGDYGDFSGGSGVDAFGQVITDATLYDLLDTPSNSLRTEDLGVLT